MISMLYRCGEQFRRRYGFRFGYNDKEEIIPPGVALIIGIATHKSVEKNMKSRIETEEYLPLEQVKDVARDEAAGLWSKEVRLVDADEVTNPKKVKAESIDTSVALAALHALQLAPGLSPKSVERKWVVNLEGFPFDLAGQWDIEEAAEGALLPSIRDTKTAAKSPNANAADLSEQLTMYSLAKKVCDNEDNIALFLDTLVKTKTPKIVTQVTTRTDHDRQILLRRIERAAEIIDMGAFAPANPIDWWCGDKWCGYWRTCPFGGKGK
jgi:hypothetical protein